jgi:hypothetical protein
MALPCSRVCCVPAGQEIPHLLWNHEVHYHFHQNLSLSSILRQFNPVHTLIPYLRFILILSSHLCLDFPDNPSIQVSKKNVALLSPKHATWDIVPCSLEEDRHFRGVRCLHHQGSMMMEAVPLKCWSTSMRLYGTISQKSVIFISVLFFLYYHHYPFKFQWSLCKC